jgi:hypothetical protein
VRGSITFHRCNDMMTVSCQPDRIPPARYTLGLPGLGGVGGLPVVSLKLPFFVFVLAAWHDTFGSLEVKCAKTVVPHEVPVTNSTRFDLTSTSFHLRIFGPNPKEIPIVTIVCWFYHMTFFLNIDVLGGGIASTVSSEPW